MNIVRLYSAKAKVTARDDDRILTQKIEFSFYAKDEEAAHRLCEEEDIYLMSYLSGYDVDVDLEIKAGEGTLDLDVPDDVKDEASFCGVSSVYTGTALIPLDLSLSDIDEEWDDHYDEVDADDRRHGI